ncbi:MAG: hypothetical protein QGI88_04910 [SAR202 cluster bacterium]|nr:hypothetical protein [SAR202 cluster bacterium]
MLLIETPATFGHAGHLRSKESSNDPRSPGFGFEHVILDLRGCQFIRPAALLWCLIYALLAKKTGGACEIWVPENMGVCVYLKSTGMIDILKDARVDIDDRGIGSTDHERLVLPLTQITSAFDAEEAANAATEALMESGFVAANLIPTLSDTFGELTNNAASTQIRA